MGVLRAECNESNSKVAANFKEVAKFPKDVGTRLQTSPSSQQSLPVKQPPRSIGPVTRKWPAKHQQKDK